ncbi:MAG: multidrug ABC transporter permease [Clostridiaceae bacterium]|nr:multidrug ABC transporter permease [Clostridiaceae bacterium]
MIEAIRIHFQGIKTALAVRMAYRADFFISTFIMLLVEFMTPLVTYLIYRNGASLPGWSMYEVLLIQGIFLLSRGIAFPFFFGIVWNTIDRVREGTFDLLLIKPRSVLHMAIITGFDSEDIGKLLGGLVLFTAALLNLPFPGISEWLKFIAIFFVSLVVMFGFAIILAGLGIVWVGNYRVYEIFFSISNFGMYPASIFSKLFQTIITSVLPISMLGFVPASVLLGKPAEGTIHSVLTSFVFLFASLLFWKTMLARYTSSGG